MLFLALDQSKVESLVSITGVSSFVLSIYIFCTCWLIEIYVKETNLINLFWPVQ